VAKFSSTSMACNSDAIRAHISVNALQDDRVAVGKIVADSRDI